MLFATLLTAAVESRRVNVKSATADDDSLSQRTTAADDDDQPNAQQFKPVLIARRPLQHRPSTEVETERQPVVVIRQSPRLLQQRPQEDDDGEQEPQVNIRQQPIIRSQHHQRAQPPPAQQQQQKETAQTIRNYNKLNDDGSFTFGYEADDGSFKEETRGTDCVVRGKYGYVDPDGNKREFSYVQGNPCDPNAVSNEDDDEQPGKPGAPAEEENVPANVPKPKPKKNRPTTTLFQQTFGDFEQPQAQLSTTPRQPGRQQQSFDGPTRRPAPQISSPLTDSPFSASFSASPVPLPAGPSPSPPPSALQFRPSAGIDNLESAIRSLPQPPSSGKSQLVPAGPNSPLAYTTELVFDPATGQYNTVIFQQVPKQPIGININQRLPLVGATRSPLQPQFQPQPQFQSSFQPHSPPQFQPQPQFRPTIQPFQPSAQFDFQRPSATSPQQQNFVQQNLVQQQQALMFQQSQNLFRQQQKQQQQQQQQIPFQPQQAQFFASPSQRFVTAAPPQFATKQRFEPQPEAHQQQFVLVQPGRTPGQQSLAAGQIDAFLRGHNVQQF